MATITHHETIITEIAPHHHSVAFVDRQFEVTRDHLSRGSAYWRHRIQRLDAMFSRTIGDNKLQKILDTIALARQIQNACITYGPCSRECVPA